jgi:hypothetical protein
VREMQIFGWGVLCSFRFGAGLAVSGPWLRLRGLSLAPVGWAASAAPAVSWSWRPGSCLSGVKPGGQRLGRRLWGCAGAGRAVRSVGSGGGLCDRGSGPGAAGLVLGRGVRGALWSGNCIVH